MFISITSLRKMFTPKVIFCFTVINTFTLLDGKKCWIRNEGDTSYYLNHFGTRGHFEWSLVTCNEDYEDCCREGCCPLPNSYIWEIILAASLICIVVVICIGGCYYFRKHCSNKKISETRSINTGNTEETIIRTNLRTGGETVPQLTSHVINYRTPPPPYEVAISCTPSAPPHNPNSKIPSYEEAMSKKIFTLT